MSRTRAPSRERGKSDPIDTLAVARAVQGEPNLPTANYDPISMELRLLVDRRGDVVATRTPEINRLLVRQALARRRERSRGYADNRRRQLCVNNEETLTMVRSRPEEC